MTAQHEKKSWELKAVEELPAQIRRSREGLYRQILLDFLAAKMPVAEVAGTQKSSKTLAIGLRNALKGLQRDGVDGFSAAKVAMRAGQVFLYRE